MLILGPAQESDVPALIALARRSWLCAFEGHAPPVFVRAWLARDFERDWYPRYWKAMTVATRGGVLLGVVQPMGDEINGLWVEPSARGVGVGSALLAHGEAEVAAAGYNRVCLTCSGFNPDAQGFYLARGYRQTGSKTIERDGGVREEILTYERAI